MLLTKMTLIALVTSATALIFTAPVQAAMDSYIETALVSVCKASATNKLHKFHSAKKAHRLSSKTIAMKVSCNGQDISSYALSQGANKTAAHLDDAVGDVSIAEIAAVKRVNVNFEG
jgi:rhamnogalacturonyl hydrolase YesR